MDLQLRTNLKNDVYIPYEYAEAFIFFYIRFITSIYTYVFVYIDLLSFQSDTRLHAVINLILLYVYFIKKEERE